MIEESEERLTENQVQKILDIVLEYFPHVRKATDEEGAEET